MTGRFEHRTVMVTGAGTGFGAELAVRAAEEGARVIVHYRSSADGARATAERVRAAGGDTVTCSIGVAEWQPGDSASMLISRADSALYAAKGRGRNRIVMAGAEPGTSLPAIVPVER